MGFDWDQVVTREIGGGRQWDTSCCHDHHQDYRDDQNLDYHDDYLEDCHFDYWDTSCCHDHHQDYLDDQDPDYHDDYLEDAFDEDYVGVVIGELE